MSGQRGQTRWSDRPAREPAVPPWPLTTSDATEIARRLSRNWPARWPGCNPIGHDLRGDASDLWVRFHGLPGSKRYPDSEAQYTEVLRRHHVLLDDLLEQDFRSTELTLIVGAWPDTDYAARGRGLDPEVVLSEYWGSVLTDSDSDGWESWLDLFVAQLALDSPVLDMILRLVVDEELHEVIVTDSDLNWLYHPYDGGADVIASSPSQRDRLADAHHDWLSNHPLGL